VYPLVRRTLASLTISIGLFAVFGMELASDMLVVQDLAFSPIYFQHPDFMYTIFTATFLHADFFHIISNVVMLAMLGLIFEERIGTPRFIAIFLISGTAGNIVYGLANLGSFGFVIGASGAITGILGAILVLYPRERTGLMMFPIPIPNLPVWGLVVLMLGWQLIFIFDPGSHVAWQGHLGGFVAGALVTPVIMRATKGKERRARGEVIDISLFANTKKEREIVERIKNESVPQVRDAWIEELARTARCPVCHTKMTAFRGGMRCEAGHKFRIGG
jgi:membrane associated rhomboid family serine protease